MRRIALSFCCIVALVVPIGGARAKQPPPADDCTWGASSVTAELVDGRWVESKPATSGCIPP
jgi:hypothetical protein